MDLFSMNFDEMLCNDITNIDPALLENTGCDDHGTGIPKRYKDHNGNLK